MALTIGSLFSGIGGIDLGLERAGMVTRWFCEIDPHCRNVLARHWPGLPVYGDITAVDWSGVAPVDVLAGGFPCQPVSSAGDQRAQEDERWLWPEFARAICELRPRYILVENVSNLLAVNGGCAMGEVLGDLAALGYDSEWDGIPAAAVGAPHIRDRIWILAYAPDAGLQGFSRHERERQVGPQSERPPHRGAEILAHPPSGRQPRQGQSIEPSNSTAVVDRQAVEPLDGRLADQWSIEPDVGRVAHGVPHRVDRLRALGNAVVPQVVEWIGARIVAFDEARLT